MNEQTETGKHLGVGKEYDFNGEKVVIKPLGVMYYGDILKVINKMRSSFKDKQPTGDEVFNLLSSDDDVRASMVRMVSETLNRCLPEKTDDEINEFAMQNMIYLFNAVIEQNSPRINKEDKNKINKILERQKLHDESIKKNTE